MSRPPPRQLDANQLKLLEQQGFTTGLVQAVSHYVDTIPLRLWVIDNSSAMQVRDGHRISGSNFCGLTKSDCTRWDEAQDQVAFHAYMSGCLGVPTRFNMVNPPISMTGMQLPSCFSVAERGPAGIQQELQTAKQIMGQVRPNGFANPLKYHIQQIRAMVVQMAPQLMREGKAVSVLIATSGLPTDANGQHGPDDEQVVDFYNTLDVQMSRTNWAYDVVDDFFGEALEVYLKIPWLNYALPLYRFRQLFSIPVFGGIDEQALSFPQLGQFCACLFPTRQPLPDPATDWVGFVRALAMLMQVEKQHFNPITYQVGPWIDLRRLHLMYGRGIPLPHDIPIQMPQQQQQQQPSFQQPPYQQQHSAGRFQQQRAPFQQQSSAGGFQQQQQRQPPYQRQNPFQQPGQSMPQQPQPPPLQTSSAPAPAPPPQLDSSVSAAKYEQQAGADESMTETKRGVITWATAPPTHQNLRSIEQLLGTVPQTFPPAYGIANLDYFKKWKPFAMDALAGREEAVLKRAMRKTKFFLHPDKLPKDLTRQQNFLCKMFWDIVADAWETFGGN